MYTTVGLTGDCASDDVYDTDVEGTTLETVPHGEDGVGGLSGLGDKDTDVIPEDGRLAVEEVRCQFDRDRDFGEFLEDGAGLCHGKIDTLQYPPSIDTCTREGTLTHSQAGVETRPASDEHDTTATPDDVQIGFQTT